MKWRSVPSWPQYEVSDRGDVRSLDRVIMNGGIPRKRKGIVLKQWPTDGYPTIELSFGGRHRSVLVHVLILETFVGPCPDGKQCRHLNGVRNDNLLSNLVWGTPLENSADRMRHGTQPLGEHHFRAKLTEEAVHHIRTNLGVCTREMAEQYGVCLETIRRVRAHTSWKHVQQIKGL